MPKRSFYVAMDSWESRHRSYKVKIEGQHSFTVYHPPSGGAARLQAYNDVTKELQDLIEHAVRSKKTLRAQGSSWSLSKVGVAEHQLINTKPLRIGFTLPDSQIVPGYPGDHTMLRFLECGHSIAEINRILFRDGLSLKASGSNNGQTLPGAFSTGTHGSAFKFGSTQDFVVGLHLITGPSKHVYLERASYPVVEPSFAAALGAELIRDDTLFNAALVSFGSFGIIHGVMIEARKLFLLHVFRMWQNYDAGLRKAITDLDFSDLGWLPKAKEQLYHFAATFNPNEGTPPAKASVHVMFEEPYRDDYERPEWDDGSSGPTASGLEIIGGLFESIPSSLHGIAKAFLTTQVDGYLEPHEMTGTIKDLFRGEKTQGKVLACGIAVPVERTQDALNVAFQTYKNFGEVFPLLLTTRFVKGTPALLGFTKYDRTCSIDVDGLNTPTMRSYVKALWKGLDAAGVDFTLHWGKFNSYLTKGHVKKMYGDNVQRWIASRKTLLSDPKVRKVFTNEFMKTAGLAP